MADIIDVIDKATGCQQCGATLGGSPSDDFCSEDCQHAWLSKRVGMVSSWFAASIQFDTSRLEGVIGEIRTSFRRLAAAAAETAATWPVVPREEQQPQRGQPGIPCGESCWADDGDNYCVCGEGTEEGHRRPAAWEWTDSAAGVPREEQQ
jgi:hypothetical protein